MTGARCGIAHISEDSRPCYMNRTWPATIPTQLLVTARSRTTQACPSPSSDSARDTRGPPQTPACCTPRAKAISDDGCVATFQKRQESDWSSRPGSVSCRHPEQVVDELNLSPHIRTAHPPRLPLPDHVHGLVALDRSPRRLKLTKPLLGFHASFDRSMILLHDVVQVLDRPVAATASQDFFLFHPGNRRVLVPVAVDSPRRYTGAMNAIDERACGKPGCDNFGKPGLNIVGHGWFVTTSGRRRRYRCTVCGGTLSTNTGTAYRGLRCSRREFDQVASLRASACLRPPE